MGNRRKGTWKGGLLRGMAALAGTLLALLGVLALAVQRGIAGEGMIGPGMIAACLMAGTAGVLWGPGGEGSGKQRFMTCALPAAALMLLSVLLARGTGQILHGALHAFSLMVPGLISLAAGGKRRSRSRTPRRMRHFGAVRR